MDQQTAPRYILTQVAEERLAFAASWVDEIIVLERSALLPLPFYDPQLLGLVHHRGQIKPLVQVSQGLNSLGKAGVRKVSSEMLTAVCFTSSLSTLAGVGMVVDRILGSRTDAELQQAQISLFHPEQITDQFWHLSAGSGDGTKLFTLREDRYGAKEVTGNCILRPGNVADRSHSCDGASTYGECSELQQYRRTAAGV
ncbi:MAG: hypothetical protein HC921_02750 [Synechococcaceae cyanobacterium SM2_3_1]|nr:hypothetical protein [Synechococcaceae cyanobacterium SM2_3_1]